MEQKKCTYDCAINKNLSLNYLLFLPKDYNDDQSKKWPMIMFLHGVGERGDDLDKIKIHGIPKIVEQKPDFPFIAVSPQCPMGSWWTLELDELNSLLDYIIGTYRIDKDMVYLTGLSMGGFGTWHLATLYPEKFAAIAPVCGGGIRFLAEKLKNMPIWAFHGAKDSTIPIYQSQVMVDTLKEVNHNVKFTVYPEAEHDCWTETYANPELYKWFLSNKRKNEI